MIHAVVDTLLGYKGKDPLVLLWVLCVMQGLCLRKYSIKITQETRRITVRLKRNARQAYVPSKMLLELQD